MAVDDGNVSDNKERVTCWLILTIGAAALGSLQYGYNIGVINAPESLIKTFIKESQLRRGSGHLSEDSIRNLWALTVAIFDVGGCFGGLLAGWWATKLGRKNGCLVNILIGIASSVLMYISRRIDSFEAIVVGRFLIGCHSGLYSGIVPMYLSEISSPKLRGGVGVIHHLGIVIGILLSQILGFPVILGTDDKWDILLGLSVLPCLLQVLILPFCPESPGYLLINKQDEDRCREALGKLRGKEHIDDGVEEIRQEMKLGTEQISIIQLLRMSDLRRPLLIGVVLHISLEFTGNNGIAFYSTSLFTVATGSESVSTYLTSAVGGTMLVMSVVTIPLMDKVGRRILQLVGQCGVAVSGLLITVSLALRNQYSWLSIASILCILAFVIFFSIGPGCIPWLIVAELFSHDARPAAISVCVLISWLASSIVGFIFPVVQNALQEYTFLPFTGFLLLSIVFTYFFVPETKGKTVEEVAAMWRPKSAPQSNSCHGDILHDGNSDNSKLGVENPVFIVYRM